MACNISKYISREVTRGGPGSEFGWVPDLDTRSLLPGRIRVVAGSGYLTCDV